LLITELRRRASTMCRAFILLSLLCCAVWSGPAAAQDRASKVALVIANAAYANVASLQNPTVDADRVEASLRAAGFLVTRADNANAATLRSTLRHFSSVASTAEVALIYFAGHGVQIDGENWLLPVDAPPPAAWPAQSSLVSVQEFADAIATATTRIVVLDACRSRLSASATVLPTQGLAAIEISDVLVLFSAGSGQVAMDGDAQGSPFAQSFAQRIAQRGIDLRIIAGQIRDDVASRTGGRQRPYVAASLGGAQVIINEGSAAAAPPSTGAGTSWIAGCWTTQSQGSMPGFGWQRTLLRMERNMLVLIGVSDGRFIDVSIPTLSATDTVVEAPRQHLEFGDRTFEIPRTTWRRTGDLMELSYNALPGGQPVRVLYQRCGGR
jgi:hypothetical protein